MHVVLRSTLARMSRHLSTRSTVLALVLGAGALVTGACGSDAATSTTDVPVATAAPVATATPTATALPIDTAAPVATGGVATTMLTTTTPSGPAVGELASPVDALAELRALSIAAEPYAGPADELAHALADELLSAYGECDLTPSAMVSTVGESPAIATIDITFGCDDATNGVVYTVTLDDPDGEGLLVFAATRQSRCGRAVDGALCV